MSSEVPEPLQAAAETVRRHLVALRGGAPFLSPSDAHQLLTWLEEGRGVGQILVAVERAATRRTRQRIRAPLSLTHARRYLKTAPAVAPVVATESGTPNLRAWLEAVPDHRWNDLPAYEALHDEVALACRQPHLSEAIEAQLFRRLADFWTAAWASLEEGERGARLEEAAMTVGDLSALLDDAQVARATEERARAKLRQTLPTLSATALWDILST